MTIEITAVGGYNEIGRQCTAIKFKDEVVIVDIGLHLDNYIKYTEDEEEDIHSTSIRGLRQAGAVPDWHSIKDWRKNVVAIVLTHAHLDHVGAVPYLANLFDCPIYGSPFTLALLRQLIDDKKIKVKNRLIPVKNKAKISNNFKLDMISITHSTIDCHHVALHTPDGVVYVDNDYKIDHHPTFGKPFDFEKIHSLSGKVKAHVAECLYAPHSSKTPSESVAKQMVEEVLLESNFKNRAVFVSTFASHIARLNSIINAGHAMGRKVVFIGRSMAKYLTAAEDAKLLKLPKHVEVIRFGSQINRFFKRNQDLSNFLVVCTGHMGEPKAILSRLVDGQFPYQLKRDDVVVFSSHCIPVPSIIANRNAIMKKLKNLHVRIFDDVHVSGHASREDIRWLISTLKAEHIIPNHGVPAMTKALVTLAKEIGVKHIHNVREGDRVTID